MLCQTCNYKRNLISIRFMFIKSFAYILSTCMHYYTILFKNYSFVVLFIKLLFPQHLITTSSQQTGYGLPEGSLLVRSQRVLFGGGTPGTTDCHWSTILALVFVVMDTCDWCAPSCWTSSWWDEVEVEAEPFCVCCDIRGSCSCGLCRTGVPDCSDIKDPPWGAVMLDWGPIICGSTILWDCCWAIIISGWKGLNWAGCPLPPPLIMCE